MLFCSRLYFSPLKRDKDGCRWMFANYSALNVRDVDRIGKVNFERAFVLFMEWLCYDENVQVNGLKWFIDYTDLSLSVLMKFAVPEDQKQTASFFNKSAPARIKAVYVYNEPTFFDIAYAMYSVFVSKKILDRVKMVGKNMSKIYDLLGYSMLPEEYLPDDHNGPSAGSESQIIEDMIKDMTSPKFMTYIQDVTSSKYGIDLGKKTKSADNPPESSFRKLNID